jgi:xylan 1,4-beta-xylosidase
MVWHYHDDDVAGPDAAVTLEIPGLPLADGNAKVTHYRIDETHSNAFTFWKALGEPPQPSASQYAELEAAGMLATLGPATSTPIADHRATLPLTLPRQGVSLVVLEWD